MGNSKNSPRFHKRIIIKKEPEMKIPSSKRQRQIHVATLIFSLFSILALVIAFRATDVSALTPTLAVGGTFTGSPTSGSAPLVVQFTPSTYGAASCVWTYGDGTVETVAGDATGHCPVISHTYTTDGTYTVSLRIVHVLGASATRTLMDYIQVGSVGPTLTPTPTVNGALPDLIVASITEFIQVFPTATIKANGCTSTPTWTRGVRVRVQNIGTADAGSFVVDMNSSQQTVSGLAAGQSVTVSFLPAPVTRNVTVDITNIVVESDETNNTMTMLVTPGPTITGTVPATVCRTPTLSPTPTLGITSTPTRTWTPTISPTPTRTPTRTPSPTGHIPTRTFTPTASSACSPVTSTITIPFIFDGAGTFCWQASSLGSFINSWNTNSVLVNNLNVTNLWVGAGSYPAKIGGFYYVAYNSSVAWGHFEAK
jgi:PKD repeat protein